MDFNAFFCFAKVFSAAIGQVPATSVTKQDVDVTFEVLKEMADNRNDWPKEKKEYYKLIADFAKEYIKDR